MRTQTNDQARVCARAVALSVDVSLSFAGARWLATAGSEASMRLRFHLTLRFDVVPSASITRKFRVSRFRLLFFHSSSLAILSHFVSLLFVVACFLFFSLSRVSFFTNLS